jgi:predicted nucleic acid-binding protein
VETVFLDANILFSAAWRPGSGLRRLWSLKGVALVTSAYAVEEARHNLPTPAQRDELVRLLSRLTIIPAPPAGTPLPETDALPEKDRPILLAAVAARATHLLTGDVTHFGRFFGKRTQGVLVLTPAEFLARAHNESQS